ncbi:hypothetical protein HOA92_00955 [archaeon]|nr:hypothetical protein [archaeon]MBT6761587.1 hypothetical protein [archaeon]MBT7929112.1 hypothetical protein [Candidatus Peregrinibacteria bacterium]
MSNANIMEVLGKLGLKQGEATVYLALLKNGKSSVRDIKTKTQLHRTGIYDFLEQLINRGLVSYVSEGNCKYYIPTPPSKFQELIDEQQSLLDSVKFQMEKEYQSEPEDLNVEVARGRESIKSFMADILRTNQNYVCIGVDETWWEEQFPIITANHIAKEKKLKIKWKAIAQKESDFVYDTPHAKYRFLPEEHLGPLHTIVYGDNVAIVIRDPLSVITIRNQTLAKAQKKQFEMLWKEAKK